jgi:hypothetical protein
MDALVIEFCSYNLPLVSIVNKCLFYVLHRGLEILLSCVWFCDTFTGAMDEPYVHGRTKLYCAKSVLFEPFLFLSLVSGVYLNLL